MEEREVDDTHIAHFSDEGLLAVSQVLSSLPGLVVALEHVLVHLQHLHRVRHGLRPHPALLLAAHHPIVVLLLLLGLGGWRQGEDGLVGKLRPAL